jgi:hypothetical protein
MSNLEQNSVYIVLSCLYCTTVSKCFGFVAVEIQYLSSYIRSNSREKYTSTAQVSLIHKPQQLSQFLWPPIHLKMAAHAEDVFPSFIRRLPATYLQDTSGFINATLGEAQGESADAESGHDRCTCSPTMHHASC